MGDRAQRISSRVLVGPSTVAESCARRDRRGKQHGSTSDEQEFFGEHAIDRFIIGCQVSAQDAKIGIARMLSHDDGGRPVHGPPCCQETTARALEHPALTADALLHRRLPLRYDEATDQLLQRRRGRILPSRAAQAEPGSIPEHKELSAGSHYGQQGLQPAANAKARYPFGPRIRAGLLGPLSLQCKVPAAR